MPDIRNIPEVKIEDLDELEKKEQQAVIDKADDAAENEDQPVDADVDDVVTPNKKENDDVVNQEIDEDLDDKIDYKEKWKASQKESIALHQSVREKEQKIEELSRPKEISENELKEKYPDWDEMTEREQKLAKSYENTQIRLTNIEAQNSIYHNEQKWSQKVDEQIKEWDTFEKFPRLIEHKDQFKQFCLKPSHKNIDLETLAKAFLFESKDIVPPKKKASTIMTSTKSKGAVTPAKKKWTGYEVKTLRETSPRKYQELVNKGEFDDLGID